MSHSIAIDGPAGAGKSTIAKKAAEKLGFIYVDTGAMYRSMALYFLREKIQESETEKIEQACKKIDITIRYSEGAQQVILNGENVTGLIRTEEVGNMASAIAVIPAVRRKLVELQRELAGKADVIMDGRDIGTYVLPQADLKIYLTASPEERARRRFRELTEKGISCDIHEIEADIIERDKRDMSRDFAPLRQAGDAVPIESSHMTIDQVVQTILREYDGTSIIHAN